MLELRMRNRIPPDEMAEKVGKTLGEADVSVLMTRACKVLKPNGAPLCVYLPGAIPEDMRAMAHPILTKIRMKTDNRGNASGGVRVKRNEYDKRTRAPQVASAILGYFDAAAKAFPFCRLSAYTAEHLADWQALGPVWGHCGNLFRQHVPDRYAVQKDYCDRSQPDWVIPDSPYSTVTVNNTYPTGVHKDVGDLEEGFSNMFVLRRGEYTGGWLTFPEYRLAVDLQDGDLILFDAHEWHGNTRLDKGPDAERISVVMYYRTKIISCGTPAEEAEKGRSKALGLS